MVSSEISVENLTEIERKYRLTAVIFLIQIITAVILLVVGYFYASGSENVAAPDFLLLLWFAVIFIAIGSFFLRRTLNRRERLKNIASVKGISGVLSALQTNSIMIGTLAETVAIIGLLIAFLGGVKFDVFRAAAVALLIFFINIPRKAVWKKVIGSLENTQEVVQ